MTEQQIDRDRLRKLADAATEGPWERGNWYHVQGSTHCTCSKSHGPLVGIDPHGTYGEMHVHRYSDYPLWENGIRARDDAVGGVDVVIETDEYGTMSDADAEFIAASRTAVPALLDQLAQAEADRDWNLRSSRLAKEGRIKANARADQAEDALDYWMARAYEAEGKLWKAEARIESLEDAAHVLVGEVLAAEDARDEHRRGKAAVEARIKAVEDVLDRSAIDGHDQLVHGQTIRKALDRE